MMRMTTDECFGISEDLRAYAQRIRDDAHDLIQRLRHSDAHDWRALERERQVSLDRANALREAATDFARERVEAGCEKIQRLHCYEDRAIAWDFVFGEADR